MSKIIPINNDSPNIEIPLNDEEMLDILGSLLMDEFYASEIWQPVPNTPKRKKAKARRKPGERYVQNYSYKPRGEKPWEYYAEKIESVGEWLVNEAKDVNYALRVYEGWLEQAIKNIVKGEWYHAVLIIDVLFWEVARYHMFMERIIPSSRLVCASWSVPSWSKITNSVNIPRRRTSIG